MFNFRGFYGAATMNDIQPPKQSPLEQKPPVEKPVTSTQAPTSKPGLTEVAKPQPKRRWLKRSIITIIVLAIVIIGCLVGVGVWYGSAQQAVDADDTSKQVVEIQQGATPEQIAEELDERGIIRSAQAFLIYTRLGQVQGELQSGVYRLSPSESLEEIVAHLSSGKTDQFSVTFYPGATLYDPRTDIEDDERTDVYTMLLRAGFTDTEVTEALEASYDHPLLADKPADASLEGYVYGDTYTFGAGATAKEVIEHTFDIFYQRIEENDIVAKLEKQDMTLYEGITLASIIEREVSGRTQDQKQVSQVFHLRLDEDMPLGADATFQYVAMQRNVEPSITIESPYNTRINKGLPPGPISSPHIEALTAAAEPADGDYVYFVSGDDGTTYFAKTQAEHEENTRKYCTTLCQQT